MYDCALILSPISGSSSLGEENRDITRQFYYFRLQAIEANYLHRAANSNETAAQRSHRQQAMIGPQIQRIDEPLGRSTNEQTSGSITSAGRPRRELNGSQANLGVL